MKSIVAWNFCRVELIIFSPFVCLYRRIIQWDIKAADAILVCSLRNESGNTEEVAGVSALRRQRDNWSWRLSDVKSTFIIILVCQCLRCGKEQCIASAASCPFFQALAIGPLSHCFVPKAFLLWRISGTCLKAVIIPNVSITWLLI